MKKLLIFIILIFPVFSFAQNLKSLRLYSKGYDAYEKKDFQKARENFQKSLQYDTVPEALYYLGIINLEEKDTCAACMEFKKALLFDVRSNMTYFTLCIKHAEKKIPLEVSPNVQFLFCTDTNICEKSIEYKYIFEDTIARAYSVIITDSEGNGTTEEIMMKIMENKSKSNSDEPDLFYFPPKCPGTNNEELKYIYQKVDFPEFKRFAGSISLSITIEEDGALSEVKINSGISDAIDEGIIKAYKTMPHWYPAMRYGKPIRVTVERVLTFNVNMF